MGLRICPRTLPGRVSLHQIAYAGKFRGDNDGPCIKYVCRREAAKGRSHNVFLTERTLCYTQEGRFRIKQGQIWSLLHIIALFYLTCPEGHSLTKNKCELEHGPASTLHYFLIIWGFMIGIRLGCSYNKVYNTLGPVPRPNTNKVM